LGCETTAPCDTSFKARRIEISLLTYLLTNAQRRFMWMLLRFNEKPFREYQAKNFSVVVGAHRLYSLEASQRRHRVHRIVAHENYLRKTHQYDIMLVQLSASIEFSDETKPICVDDSEFPADTRCVVTGWGRTSTRSIYDFLYFSSDNSIRYDTILCI